MRAGVFIYMGNNGYRYPETINEAVDALLAFLPAKIKALSHNMDQQNYMQFVTSIVQMANIDFGLFGENRKLLEAGDKNYLKPELALTTIVLSLWKRLQNQDEVYEREGFDKLCNIIVPDFKVINQELLEYFSKHPEHLYDLAPRKFEELLDAIFNNLGYRTEIGPGWNDGGIDLRIFQRDDVGEICTLVQAKRYKSSNPISLEAVAALDSLVQHENANRGLFVTTSRYLPGVKKFAEEKCGRRLTLATSEDISKWCEKVKRKYMQYK